MGYYTRAQLVTQLEAVESSITRAQDVQSFADGTGAQVSRASLAQLERRRDKLLREIQVLDNKSGGGFANLVEFQR